MSEYKYVEITRDEYTLDADLRIEHARWLRGAIARNVDRAELHQHHGDRLGYKHPLVRFDVSTGFAVVAGIAEGAVMLRSVPPFTELTLGRTTHPVLAHRRCSDRVEIGPTSETSRYELRTPYLALNQENHGAWDRGSTAERDLLLKRIVIGNMLSLSKAIDLHVEERLRAEVALEPDGWHEIKPGVRLLGFRGTICVNFRVPELWGIGKCSARGFGTLNRLEA